MVRVYCDRCEDVVEEDQIVKKEYGAFHRPTLFSGSTTEGDRDWILCRDCSKEFRKLCDRFYNNDFIEGVEHYKV